MIEVIKDLREQGNSYRAIASIIGIKRRDVTRICDKHQIPIPERFEKVTRANRQSGRLKTIERQQREIYCCEQCGKKYIRRRRGGEEGKKYCSRSCAFIAKAKRCKTCGRLIKYSQSSYCSEECKKTPRECRWCGKTFKVKGQAQFCSYECRQKHYNEKSRQREIKFHSPRKCICKICSEIFYPEYGNKRKNLCSNKCEKESKRRDQKNRKHLKKIKIPNRFKEKFYDIEIFARDQWQCQICGKKLSCQNIVPHPLAPTLDHIIPLSKGGTHTRGNVQLLCFSCNCRKGDRTMPNGEQLWLM